MSGGMPGAGLKPEGENCRELLAQQRHAELHKAGGFLLR